MKRPLTLACVFATLTLAGCAGYYVPREATPAEELQANVAASEAKKQERLK